MKQNSKGDLMFNIVNNTIATLAFLIVLYPLVFVISASISNPSLVVQGQVYLFPKEITFEGFKAVFQYGDIWMGYRNTVFYTLSGILVSLFIVIPAAYALSKRTLAGRSIFITFFAITMFFAGGLIPTYLLIRGLGMRDTVFSQIIPTAASFFYIIIARTYFQSSIPEELEESALIDGCSHIKLFFKIVLPLSKPILAVMALYAGVRQWNSYYNALIYLSNRNLYTLQLILREILVINQIDLDMIADEGILAAAHKQIERAELLKYAIIIVSTLPVIAVYPFLQKYFVKGIMIGALKG